MTQMIINIVRIVRGVLLWIINTLIVCLRSSFKVSKVSVVFNFQKSSISCSFVPWPQPFKNSEDPKQNYEPPPPINISNLEMNELTPFGEGKIEFDQNSVPFDFDGQRLMWMNYIDGGDDKRELNFYDFRYDGV